MRLVLATSGFAHPGGSESYLLTTGEQLERLGHSVTIRATELGAIAEEAESRGVRVVARGDGAAAGSRRDPRPGRAQRLRARGAVAFRAAGVPRLHGRLRLPAPAGPARRRQLRRDGLRARRGARPGAADVVRDDPAAASDRRQAVRAAPADRRASAPRGDPGQLPPGPAAGGADRGLGGSRRRMRARAGPVGAHARARAGDERGGHRRGQGAGDPGGDGVRAGRVRLRLRRARRMGDRGDVSGDGGGQLRRDGDRGRDRRPRARGRPRGLRRADGRRQPRSRGPPS